MYQLIIMYGDNEPWWLFEDWQDDIIEEYQSDRFHDCYKRYQVLSQQLKETYQHYVEKDGYMMAFWNDGEEQYCDDCDEDLQQYKGLLITRDYQKIETEGKCNGKTANYSGKAKCCSRYRQDTRSR